MIKGSKYVAVDNDGKKTEMLKDLILHCLLDCVKLKTFNIKIKNDRVKVWIYHNLDIKEIKNYEEIYKRELKEIEDSLKKKKNKIKKLSGGRV